MRLLLKRSGNDGEGKIMVADANRVGWRRSQQI